MVPFITNHGMHRVGHQIGTPWGRQGRSLPPATQQPTGAVTVQSNASLINTDTMTGISVVGSTPTQAGSGPITVISVVEGLPTQAGWRCANTRRGYADTSGRHANTNFRRYDRMRAGDHCNAQYASHSDYTVKRCKIIELPMSSSCRLSCYRVGSLLYLVNDLGLKGN